jgi:hypothetical protein
MISDSYRQFFVVTAGASAALIGLLFVAISVAPQRNFREGSTDAGSRASAALLLFSNVFVLSLAALVPGVTVGWWAVCLAAVVLAFAAATARLAMSPGHGSSTGHRSRLLVLGLIVIAGFEMYGGVEAAGDAGGTDGLQTIDYVVIAALAVGIARAWDLIGLRDTGVVASLRTLVRGSDRSATDHPDAGQ